MQAPFWKAKNDNRKDLENDFVSVVKSCGLLNIELIVIPLVDNGSINNPNEMNSLSTFYRANKIFLIASLFIFHLNPITTLRI